MSEAKSPTRAKWLKNIHETYNSQANSTFLLHGNVCDIFPHQEKEKSLTEYLVDICGPRNIILKVDPASGIEIYTSNEYSDEGKTLLQNPDQEIMERLHQFLLYISNLPVHQNVSVFITNANYLLGERNDFRGGLLLKRWTEDPHFTQRGILTFLISESLKDLHETILTNQRIQKVEVPYPSTPEIKIFLENQATSYPKALPNTKNPKDLDKMSDAMSGTSLHGIQSLIKKQNYEEIPIEIKNLDEIKRNLVEQESRGLITFLTPKNTLADLAGKHSRQIQTQFEDDIALWEAGKIDLIPNGYLISGPSGTGKTFFLRCLAGSTSIPVMQINNFRDQYQGVTEANLELIFRLARSMTRVLISIDEADQALGNRTQSSTDGGVSGRVYAAFTNEMSNLDNRGRIVWILLTSHPQNLEVDLKRPGRCDIRIPLLPCETPEAGRTLICEMASHAGLEINEKRIGLPPELLTPSGANTIVEAAKRKIALNKGEKTLEETFNLLIKNYQAPNLEKMWEMTQKAIAESSSKEFIPESWQHIITTNS